MSVGGEDSPDDALGPGADGLEVLVALEDGELGVAHLHGVEVRVAGGHCAGGRRRRVRHAARYTQLENKQNNQHYIITFKKKNLYLFLIYF